MVEQSMVEEHANRILVLSLQLQEQLSEIVDGIIPSVVAAMVGSLNTRSGIIAQIPRNTKALLEVENFFKRELDASDYYPTILAFVSIFVEQLGEFENLFFDMVENLQLNLPNLDADDNEVLANQAAAATSVLDGISFKVHSELRSLLARSLGEVELSSLVKGVSEIIRKMSKVEQIAKDQLILFFRSICSLIYRKIEADGTKLLYKYVGPKRDNSRDFCKALMARGPLTKEDIDAMNNDQVHNVFDNGGGFNCDDWWAIVGVVA